MDYAYLSKMAVAAETLCDAAKRSSGSIVKKLVLETARGDREISANSLSSVCIEQIEQALIAEAERYGYRIRGYIVGKPDANLLYKD